MAHRITIGVDEAGRGPLAGPVVAAAVWLPDGHGIDGLDDSKALSATRREALAVQIRQQARSAFAVVDVAEIDRINILQASLLAMKRAVEELCAQADIAPQMVLVDGNRLPEWTCPAEAVVGGDALHPCISAASIIAKVERDAIMIDAARSWPGYGWERNKGYGTKEHLQALRSLGPSPLHRRSFAPVAQASLPLEM